MNTGWRRGGRLAILLLTMLFTLGCLTTAYAEQSDDNSLSSLGIQTQGATVSPDFSYDHLDYDVVVPSGTNELALDPVLSNPNATINSVEGTTLTDGAGTVTITTTAPSGAMTAYTLKVTTAVASTASDPSVDPAQAIAAQEGQQAASGQTAEAAVAQQQAQAAQSEKTSESETEDPRYVKVDKNTLQDAEDTISRLQKDVQVYKDRSHSFLYVIYGLVTGCIVLLFLVVNLALRKKDLAAELKDYRKKKSPQEMMDSGDLIPQDGWLDDEPVERPRSRKKQKAQGPLPQYVTPKGEPAGRQERPVSRNAKTSWTDQQVGTPMEQPKVLEPYDGYAAKGGRKGKGKKSPVSDQTRMYRAASFQGQDSRQVPGERTVVLPAGRPMTGPDPGRAQMSQGQAGLRQTGQMESGQSPAQTWQGRQAQPAVRTPAQEGPAPVSSGQGNRQDIQVDLIDL